MLREGRYVGLPPVQTNPGFRSEPSGDSYLMAVRAVTGNWGQGHCRAENKSHLGLHLAFPLTSSAALNELPKSL